MARRSSRNQQMVCLKQELDIGEETQPRATRKRGANATVRVAIKPDLGEGSEDETASDEENLGGRNAGLSEYERQIQLNIEERQKMFKELVGSAKTDFMKTITQAVSDVPAKATQRGFKRKKSDEPTAVEPLRMSLRSRKKPLEFSIDNNGDVKPTHLLDATRTAASTKVSRSGQFSLADVYADQTSLEDSKQFIESMVPLLEKKGELEKLPADLQDFMKLMNKLDITEEGVAKVVKSRIYSLTWHPCTSKLLVAAGDRDGNIGFWDVENRDDKHQGVRVFQVHSHPVNCVSFDQFHPTRLLSTSYDGFVRCLDFQSSNVDEVYCKKRSKDTWTAYHAQKDASTLIVSQSNGEVVVVDIRVKPGAVQNTMPCFENSARTLSLHPQNDHHFMVCNRYGEVGIFDWRHRSKEELLTPVVSFEQAPKGVHGAFFSPLTGKYALTTCTDDTLKLYDVHSSGQATCVKSIYHNNFTGRWLTPFKAVWHPQREDVFVVGSMEKPTRRIEMFGAPDGQLLHTFKGEWMSSVCCINAFHPSLPILAGGNASGRVHIFRSSDA